jgi:hypothetical protein
MKILTATNRTQGQRDNDFHWCIEGEIVIPPVQVCDRDLRNPDGGCGCGRGWSGLNSHRATTTAMVRDLDGYTPDDLAIAVRSSLEQSGWYPRVLDDADVTEYIAEVARVAESYPVGAVLETRGGTVRWRDSTEEANR